MIRFLKSFLLAMVMLGCGGVAWAHIGSPAAVLDAQAGPYPVRVIVIPPPVVPGQAQIDVRFLSAGDEQAKVTVLPVNWRAGLKGAPAPDVAEPVPGEPNLRHAELWMMVPSSYSVHVSVSGPKGSGTVVVPVVAVATRRLKMNPALGALLGFLGLALVSGAAGIAGAAARESILPPGEAPARRNRRIGAVASVGAAAVLLAGTYGGKRWWDAEDAWFRSNQLYRANPLDASVRGLAGHQVLSLRVEPDGTYFTGRLQLIPDHGKLMHLFMIREPELDAMAHLHPVRTGGRTFAVQVPPPLPPGHYRLYADITYETGFAATLTTAVDVGRSDGMPGSPAQTNDNPRLPTRDSDDASFVGTPASAAAQPVHLVYTGSPRLRSGEDLSLDFRAEDSTGKPVEIEPYMGMLGHAAIRRSDGTVFAHIHPIGTVSMAAQMYFEAQAEREGARAIAMDPNMHLTAPTGATTLSFPYLFPKPGQYRLWIQTKVHDQVLTGVFDLRVQN